MNRRSFLARICALLASVPLLRRGATAASRPSGPTSGVPFDFARWQKQVEALANDEAPGPFPLADTYGKDEMAGCPTCGAKPWEGCTMTRGGHARF